MYLSEGNMAPSLVEDNMPAMPNTKTEDPSNPLNPDFLPLLDDDFVQYYEEKLSIIPKTHLLSIEQIRASGDKYSSPWCRDFSYLDFVKDIELAADDGHVFKVRCYSPDEKTSPFGSGPYPVYINFHGMVISRYISALCRRLADNRNGKGGGWTFGGLTGDAEICMAIRDRLGILVMDVDYRLSPGRWLRESSTIAWR